MICPNCGERMMVTHTYTEGNCEARNLKCVPCGYRASSLTFMVVRTKARVRLRMGAKRLLQQVRDGEIENPVPQRKSP